MYPNTTTFYVEMISYLTLSKIPFTDKGGHLIKSFRKEIGKQHEIASHLLKEFATETEVVDD